MLCLLYSLHREEKAHVKRCVLHFCFTILKLTLTFVPANLHRPLMLASLNSILSKYTLTLTINDSIIFIVIIYSPSLHEVFYSSIYSNNAEGVRTVLDQVSWTEEASIALENLLSAKLSAICLDSKVLLQLWYLVFVTVMNYPWYLLLHIESVKLPLPWDCSIFCWLSLWGSWCML